MGGQVASWQVSLSPRQSPSLSLGRDIPVHGLECLAQKPTRDAETAERESYACRGLCEAELQKAKKVRFAALFSQKYMVLKNDMRVGLSKVCHGKPDTFLFLPFTHSLSLLGCSVGYEIEKEKIRSRKYSV